MPSVQIREILETLMDFYGKLADVFESHRDQFDGQMIPFLIDYIAHHERQIQLGIKQFQSERADEALLNTWFQFGAAETLEEILQEIDLHTGMSEADVLAEGLKTDSRLISLYQELAGESSVTRVSEFFDDLAKIQDARARQLARALE